MRKIIDKNSLYFVNGANQIWHFYFSAPDSIGLGDCYVGEDREEKFKEEATDVDEKYLVELRKHIEPSGCWRKGNFNPMVKILSKIFDISKKEVKEYLGYNALAVEILKELGDGYEYHHIINHINDWGNDKERIIKYMKRFENMFYQDGALVDIFPSEEDLKRPTWHTENFLLHKFHNSWSDDLDKFIKEAVEKYPDPNDFDLAAYYVDELFIKNREKLIEELKKRNNGKSNS